MLAPAVMLVRWGQAAQHEQTAQHEQVAAATGAVP